MLINYIPVIQNPVGSSKTAKRSLNSVLLLPWESGQPAVLKSTNYLWLKVCMLAQQKNTVPGVPSVVFHFQKTKEQTRHTSIRDTE